MNPFLFNSWFVFAALFLVVLLLPFKKGKSWAFTLVAVGEIVLGPYPSLPVRLFYVGMCFFVLLVAWIGGRLRGVSGEKKSRGAITASLVVTFLPLFFFKLIIAVVPVLVELISQGRNHIDATSLLPVGMSYFTFRAASYLIELYRGTIEPVSFRKFVNYAFFWPTLIAGPIERPGPFFSQAEQMVKPDRADITYGLYRIGAGFFKKTVLAAMWFQIARPFLYLSDGKFDYNLGLFTVPHLWLCILAYYAYLYLDFSGYSDLAIGVSRMLGFRIMENFRRPYMATNPAEFWRNWHISMTGWITDYIYYPLGGNRKGVRRATINTFIAMITVGAWHGLNFHFLAFGAYHATLLVLYRNWRKQWRDRWFGGSLPGPSWVWSIGGWLLTLMLLLFGWSLFLFPVGKSLAIWAKMLGLS